MPKDIIAYTELDSKPLESEALDILLISTAGEKTDKLYRSVEEVEADFPPDANGKDHKITRKVKVLFNQDHTLADTLFRKVRIVGVAKPQSPADLLTSIEAYQKKNNDWYVFATDNDEIEYLKALAAWAEASEPTEAQLDAGVEDRRKFYFLQYDDHEKIQEIKNARTAPVFVNELEEEGDVAYLGNVGPWYPRSVNWKWKTPDGITVSDLTDAQHDALEEANINFMTDEYKKVYMKNGTCANGEFIDVVMGGDYITFYMREALYDVFLTNGKVSYTDAGFALVVEAVYASLDRATDLNTIARDPETGKGVYTIIVPKRSDATDEQSRARRMPDILWEAELDGAVNNAKVKGVLKAKL